MRAVDRALVLVAALALAGCLSKPSRPGGGGDGDGGPDDADADPFGGDAGCGVDPTPGPMEWDPEDVIQFNHRAGQLNGDCRDDLAVPGFKAVGETNGVFVVLGREDGVMLDGYDGFLPTDDGATVAAEVKLIDHGGALFLVQ
jgi:hypothetical protein